MRSLRSSQRPPNTGENTSEYPTTDAKGKGPETPRPTAEHRQLITEAQALLRATPPHEHAVEGNYSTRGSLYQIEISEQPPMPPLGQDAYPVLNDSPSFSTLPNPGYSSSPMGSSHFDFGATAFDATAHYPPYDPYERQTGSFLLEHNTQPAISNHQESPSIGSSKPTNGEQYVQEWGTSAHLAFPADTGDPFFALPNEPDPSAYSETSYRASRGTVADHQGSSSYQTSSDSYPLTAGHEHAEMPAGSSSSHDWSAMPPEDFNNFEKLINATTLDDRGPRGLHLDIRGNLRPQEPNNNHYDEQGNLRPRKCFKDDILLPQYRILPEQYRLYTKTKTKTKTKSIVLNRAIQKDIRSDKDGKAYLDASKAYNKALNAFHEDQKAAGLPGREMTYKEKKTKWANEQRKIARSGLQYLADRDLSIDTTTNKSPTPSTLHTLAINQYKEGSNTELDDLLPKKDIFIQKVTVYHANVECYQHLFKQHVKKYENNDVVPELSNTVLFDGRSLSYKKDKSERPANHFHAGMLRPTDHFDEHDILLPKHRISTTEHNLFLQYHIMRRKKLEIDEKYYNANKVYLKAEEAYDLERVAAKIIPETRRESGIKKKREERNEKRIARP